MAHFVVLAFALFFGAFSQTQYVPAVPSQENTFQESSFINVSVASLWKEPDMARDLDQPAMAAPVDMKIWTSSMKLQDKLWLVGKLETQALYGQKVEIIDSSGDWVKVVIPGQFTPKEERGYPGWIPKAQLTTNSSFAPLLLTHSKAVVKVKTAFLYDDPSLAVPFMEISFNTTLPILEQKESVLKVKTPKDGDKWISKTDVLALKPFVNPSYPTEEDIVSTASSFLGLPYLWAGTSGFGFDCSGFTSSVYKFYGISIPRDASVQAVHGTPVNRDELRPGDLLFFAHEKGKGSVHHVAMYIGNGKMIHSPKSDRSVEIIPIDTPAYAVEYAGARRYLKSE